MDYSRLAASAPINAIAARQTGQGEHWAPKREFTEEMLDICPGLQSPSWYSPDRLAQACFVDLRGTQVGRLRVLGVSTRRFGNDTHRWVCRCACGHFVFRKARSLKTSSTLSCAECHYVDWLRRGMPARPPQVKAVQS